MTDDQPTRTEKLLIVVTTGALATVMFAMLALGTVLWGLVLRGC